MYVHTYVHSSENAPEGAPCVCVFIACGLKIIAADVEHGAIASQTWGVFRCSLKRRHAHGAQLGRFGHPMSERPGPQLNQMEAKLL